MKKISRNAFLKLMGISTAAAGLVACGGSSSSAPASSAPAAMELPTEFRTFDAEAYGPESTRIYNEQLGEFYAMYESASAEKLDLNKRYAEMALVEAKLMESAVMFPTQGRGGNYAMGRVAPMTVTSTKWGNDDYRFHNIVVTTEPIKAAERDEMKAHWQEVRGTGTYEQWVKDYLTGKGYTLKDTYDYAYSSDPKTWDVLATSRAADSEAILPTYDGLMEYDCENVHQPALAESYDVSEDGLTYTMHLRSTIWVDNQGRKVADLVADDFVAAMQHMCDAQGGLEFLVKGVIVNVSEYIDGTITDFSEVGVKALDDHTVEYTLVEPCPYFTTMMSYGLFAPMSRAYYVSKGGQFGAEYDPSAATYTYGTSPENIAYCGPYLVTNATAENTIVYQANKDYWNAANINMKAITWKYNDGSDALKVYTDMKAGVLDGCGLTAERLEAAKADGNDEYIYTSLLESTSYMGFLNLNRYAFANVADATVAVSTQTPGDAYRTNLAMNNVHFRRALCFAFDRAAYNAQSVGEDLKFVSVINSYTPADFVSLSEDTTVTINGSEVTFPAGTYYGEIEQAQLDADGVKITVFDKATQSGSGFDGWYNPANAVAELELAVAELGFEISEENPIYIDMPYPGNSTVYTNRAMALQQSLASTFGGKVVMNTIDTIDYNGWYYTGYYTDYGYEANYDIYDLSGWGPDYGDPSTYLDTFLPDYAGYMIKCIGIF